MTRHWLKRARKATGRTQRRFARDMGVSYSYYSKIEQGALTPPCDLAQEIGRALGVDWTQFYEPLPRVQ